MKAFRRLCIIILFAFLLVLMLGNAFLWRNDTHVYREYRVDVERAADQIAQYGLDHLDLECYPTLVRVVSKDTDDPAFYIGEGEDYVIRIIDGIPYRFDYIISLNTQRSLTLLLVNGILLLTGLLIIGILWYIKRYVLTPFFRLRDLPYELSKGNLHVPLQESKNRYFDRFTWGMDLLRERLEYQKEEEARLQKEKKTLILSLTHDIKTPLSAIKLYAKALSKHLYRDVRKQADAANQIEARADDIEAYISQIITAAGTDFLHLETHNSEFYLSALLHEIEQYYTDKLDYLKIPFAIDPYMDCLIYGDEPRCVEVLQNIMENAIKYGEGSEIRITFSDEEDHRLISISNARCTLSENELPHIFDSFWRGANSEAVKGSGLGLYICRELLHQMEGNIYATKKEDHITMTVVLRKA